MFQARATPSGSTFNILINNPAINQEKLGFFRMDRSL